MKYTVIMIITNASLNIMSVCADGPLVNFQYSVHTVARANISNLILLSLVFYRSCSNSGCEGKFTVDGNTLGILNMGRFSLGLHASLFTSKV